MSSSYKAIRPERLYEQIVDQIEQRIVDGGLKTGDQLPTEHALAQQFQVSRTAVREAVKVLREKGLVEAYPGRGTFVTDRPSKAVRQSLDFLMKLDQSDGFKNLNQVREVFEPQIAELAAVQANEENIVALQKAVEVMDAAIDDVDRFIEADLAFHLSLAEATQNALIPLLIDPIIDLLREQRKRIFSVAGGGERGQYHHKRILETIIHRDTDGARQAMEAHLQQIREDNEAAVEHQ